jgi:uncharacterized protein
MTPPAPRRRGPPRVVLDSNVVISALVFHGGAGASLRHAWTAGECAPLVSSATTQELMRVLGYPKFRLSAAEQEELLADYLPYCQAVRVPLRAPAIPVCRDPFDLPFLQLAVAGKAQALVTGDRDLLVLAPQLKFAILTLQQFVATVRQA